MRELDTFAVLYSKEANLKRGKINVFISGGYMGRTKPEAGSKDSTSSVCPSGSHLPQGEGLKWCDEGIAVLRRGIFRSA